MGESRRTFTREYKVEAVRLMTGGGDQISAVARDWGISPTLRGRRNAWAYVDTSQIATLSLSKFAPGWDVNLPMSCRVVGDSNAAYPDAVITSLPMTLRPTDAARDAELELQVMLTTGESVKGQAKMGMISNYLVRKVRLRVLDQ